jgi:hypothetical protein
MPHKPFPYSVELSVLVKCKRRCALCFGLQNDGRGKRGQLAHIDRDGENVSESNAASLCVSHHELYDSTSRQAKGFLPGELKSHQESLWAYVQTIKTETTTEPARQGNISGIGIDVYDRRIPMYRVAMQFVRDVCANLRPDIQLVLKFARETDEAQFLFDSSVAEYLETLFTKALRLHTIGLIRERMATENEPQDFQAILAENIQLAEWFVKQHEEIRSRFAPFLSLSPKPNHTDTST